MNRTKTMQRPKSNSQQPTSSEQTISTQYLEFPYVKLNDKTGREHTALTLQSIDKVKSRERGGTLCPLSSIKSSSPSCKSHCQLLTSEEMLDRHHKASENSKSTKPAELCRPRKENFVGGPPSKFVGTSPPNIDQIARMSKPRQKFFLTQDPRKCHSLVNPNQLHSRNENDSLTKMVKHAKNTSAASAPQSSESSFICEVIDLENPLQLDFQGLDYKNTYQKDEQDLQNQRYYRRVQRVMDRKRIKTETKVRIEEELRQERLQIPKCFDVRDRNVPPRETPREEPRKMGQLFRSSDKPLNRLIINMEEEQRQIRYKNLYLAKKARQDQDASIDQKRREEREKNLGLILAQDNFNKIVSHIDCLIAKSFKKERFLRQPSVQRRIFPHTMRETLVFKRQLKQKNLEKRDKARVKQEFYIEHCGKHKAYPEADMDITSDSVSHPSSEACKLSEQSSDDEDNMNVGKDGSKYKLRGFHFKLGNSLRGKLHQRDRQQTTHKEKTCITRDQWLKELAPKKAKVKLDVEKGIQYACSPDDPKLVLFHPNMNYRPPTKDISAVKEFRCKPLGQHYNRVIRKEIKIVKPRLPYSVKKFNLIGYRYGGISKRMPQIKAPLTQLKIPLLEDNTTEGFIIAKTLQEHNRQHEINLKRLELLGIPFEKSTKTNFLTKCENVSSSSNSEWIPEKEPDFDPNDSEQTQADLRTQRTTLRKTLPLNTRTNMPAPKFREPTLRQHPRRYRDYKNERVPSEIFDQVVQTTNIPYMYNLPRDMVDFANLCLKKRPYIKMLEARHHHDHWNPLQQNNVDVHYQPVLVKPQTIETKPKSERALMKKFQTAKPPCSQFVEMNLTMPQWDIDEMIKNYRETSQKVAWSDDKVGAIKTENRCHQNDFIHRSRNPEELKELDYPGRQEYLQLLQEVKAAVQESKQTEKLPDRLYVNKTALLQDLEEDLQSIENCLTSLSSSAVTNLTNDSGSFLLMEGKEKIPLDFVRKSLVPFEEIQRSRFRALPIDIEEEEGNPFRVLPFSGQKKAQLELTTPKDTFFTFNTRLKNGMRLRLEVSAHNIREKLIGLRNHKYKGMVTTDIDENYVEVLKNRPPVKMFNYKSCRSMIKDAYRLKFESLLIQREMARTKVYDRLNDNHWLAMNRLKLLFEDLFAKWEKNEYEACMSMVYMVKSFYDETDRLKSQFKLLEKELVILNMDIVFLEDHWIRCVILQNFHYLLGDQEWRLENDWIHRLPCEENDGTENKLESFEDSIVKRTTVNVRQREKDDAWAIKAYYEDVYLQNRHPNLIVFPDANSFLQGVENLKDKTFLMLLEMHFTLTVHIELQGQLETFVDWCREHLDEKRKYVGRKCAKLYFVKDRADWLRQRTVTYLEEPIEESFNDVAFLRDTAVIIETWRRIVPVTMRGSSEQLQPAEMVAMISDVVIELLSKFETLPMEESLVVESKLRSYRNYQRRQSQHACYVERRIEQEMKKVVRNLEPAYKKPKGVRKLHRYHLKKPVPPVEAQETKISDRAKFFFEAFHDANEDIMKTSAIRDSIAEVDTIQEQIVPFYFDHFLKLNGYTPNYNFKTNVEMRDGPELDRMKVRSVVPEIQERILHWEAMKKKIMEDNIAKNPKMYINVV